MKRFIPILCAALVMAACDLGSTANGPRAGGEDFPNTVQALGRALALGADSSGDWNSLDSADIAVSGDASLSDTVRLVAARGQGLWCSDTSYEGALSGAIYFKVGVQCPKIGLMIQDSLALSVVDRTGGGKDTVFYAIQVDSTLLGEYRKLITIVDADGDGRFLFRNDPGRAVLSARKTAGRWTLWSRMVMDPGADGLWDPGEDNRVYSGSRTLLLLTDTIQHELYTSYVAGAPVLSGKLDSNLVWVDKIRRHPARVRSERGLIMAYRDSTRNYPAFWRSQTDWAGGGVRYETVFGSRADSQFVAGDTVTLLDRAKRDGDSLRVEVRAKLSPIPNDRTRDSLLSLRAERYRSGAFERKSVWEFVSDKPIANGKDAESGELFARVDFSDGRWILFDGRWDLGVFTGTFSTGNDSGTIVVNRDGTVRSVSSK